MAPGWGAGLCCLFPSPLSLASSALLTPCGQRKPSAASFPGARWEPSVVFRFLYCGLTLPHIKNSSHGCRDTMLLEGCQQLHLVACASSLGLCRPLLGAHPVVTPEERVPYRALPDLGRVKVVGRCSPCPLALVYEDEESRREYPDSARGPATLDRRLSLGLLSSWLESRAPSFPFCPLLGFQHKAQIFREHGLGRE